MKFKNLKSKLFKLFNPEVNEGGIIKMVKIECTDLSSREFEDLLALMQSNGFNPIVKGRNNKESSIKVYKKDYALPVVNKEQVEVQKEPEEIQLENIEEISEENIEEKEEPVEEK